MVEETIQVRISIPVEEIVIFVCKMYTNPKTIKNLGMFSFSLGGGNILLHYILKESLFLFPPGSLSILSFIYMKFKSDLFFSFCIVLYMYLSYLGL